MRRTYVVCRIQRGAAMLSPGLRLELRATDRRRQPAGRIRDLDPVAAGPAAGQAVGLGHRRCPCAARRAAGPSGRRHVCVWLSARARPLGVRGCGGRVRRGRTGGGARAGTRAAQPVVPAQPILEPRVPEAAGSAGDFACSSGSTSSSDPTARTRRSRRGQRPRPSVRRPAQRTVRLAARRVVRAAVRDRLERPRCPLRVLDIACGGSRYLRDVIEAGRRDLRGRGPSALAFVASGCLRARRRGCCRTGAEAA